MIYRRTFQNLLLSQVGLLAATGRAQAANTASAAQVGRFTSIPKAYSTNNFWIAGTEGVVMFDTQFLPSDAVKSYEAAQKQTGLPVKTAIILHPNPDKFNGTAELQKRGVRVITSRQVADLIASVHDIRIGWFLKDYAPDYPKDAAKPDVFGSATTTLNLHGVSVQLHVLGGAGCSGAHVCAQVGDALFVGDLLANRGHAWMELALFDAWAARLKELKALPGIKRVFVGRGEPAGVELIDQMATYLQTVQRIVRAENPSGDISWLKRRMLKSRIESAFAGYEWDGFVWESLPDIWKSVQK